MFSPPGGVGLAEPVVRGRQRHQRAVQVVGRAAQHAERTVGPQLERLAALGQVLGGFRDEERGRDGFAGRRRGVGQDVPVGGVMLHVVQIGVAGHDVAEGGMVGHAAGQGLAVDLHVDAGGGQPLEEFTAGACRHIRDGTVWSWAIVKHARVGRAVHVPAGAEELADRHRDRRRRSCRRPGGRRLGAACRVVRRRAADPVHRLRHPPGAFDDRNVGARRPRLVVLAFITASVAAGLILLVLLGAPAC